MKPRRLGRRVSVVRAQIEGLRSAWRLYQSDDDRETYAALAISGVVLAPVAYRLWRRQN